MPTIPEFYARQALPSSGGQGARGGIVGVPAVTQPGLQDSGPTALERTLGALPEAVQQAGGLAVRTEELQAHRQKVFDTLNGKEKHQDYRLRQGPLYAELQKDPDWQTFPERVTENGLKLIEEMGADLTPYARRIFQDDAKQTLAAFQQRAIEERTKRTENVTTFTTAREFQQAQTALAQARTPYEVLLATGQLEETAKRFVALGLMDGGKMATGLQHVYDAVQDERVQTATAAAHDAMKRQLQTQAKIAAGIPLEPGEALREDLPTARPETLPKLTQEAVEMSRAKLNEAEHRERQDDYHLKKRQERNSVEIRTSLYATPPIPENVPTFQKLREQTITAMKSGDIDPVTGEHLLHTGATMEQAAKAPRQTDDAATEIAVRLLVQRAESPAEFAAARQTLTTIMEQPNPKLKPETFSQLADKIDQREKAAYWRERPAVKAGKDVLIRGVMVPYGGSLAGIMRPQMQQKLLWAMDAYEQQIQQLADKDIREADKQAVDLAWQARIQFLKPEKDDPTQEYLPPEAQAAQTRHDLAVVISKLRSQGWADGSLAQIVQNWHAWRDYEEQSRSRSSQGRGTQAQPRSYQLPGASPGTAEPRSK